MKSLRPQHAALLMLVGFPFGAYLIGEGLTAFGVAVSGIATAGLVLGFHESRNTDRVMVLAVIGVVCLCASIYTGMRRDEDRRTAAVLRAYAQANCNRLSDTECKSAAKEFESMLRVNGAD